MAQIIHIPRWGAVTHTVARVNTQYTNFSDDTIGVEFPTPEDGSYRLAVTEVEAHRLINALHGALMAKAERLAGR